MSLISPSILSADFFNLSTDIRMCEKGGADYLHVDVMDNHFVPNLTIGPLVLRSIRPKTDLFLDVHLMITNPEKSIKHYADAGADGITFHLEATNDPLLNIDLIRNCKKQIGISIKPATPVSVLKPFLPLVDMVLIMSVEPGFGGQSFIPQSLERIKTLKSMINGQQPLKKVLIEVDGGVTLANAPEIVQAGVDILVAGSAIFKSSNPVETIKQFKKVNLQ